MCQVIALHAACTQRVGKRVQKDGRRKKRLGTGRQMIRKTQQKKREDDKTMGNEKGEVG